MAYNGYTEARKKCNEKYLAKFDKITIRITPEEHREIERLALAAGKSINQYIKDRALSKE